MNSRKARGRDHQANVPGPWIYVETGDVDLDTDISPEWLNGFGYTSPVAFRHGLDGQTDMIGNYDLVTGSPVSGDVAFVMPLRWAQNAPEAADFPVELDTDVWTIAVQTVNRLNGNVRIFWPIVANPVP